MHSNRNCCSVSLIEPQSAWNELVIMIGSNASDLNGLFSLMEVFKQLLARCSLVACADVWKMSASSDFG